MILPSAQRSAPAFAPTYSLNPFPYLGLALVLVALQFCIAVQPSSAQSSESSTAIPTTSAATVVPNLIRFSGTLTDGRGYPITVPIDATFSLYSQPTSAQSGETPLWQEKQRVAPNDQGVYTVYLGAATVKGLPPEVFTSVTAQYLGVKLDGEPEQTRVPLVSVPYALKANDAQTLGGLPASAFALASSVSALAASTSSTQLTSAASPLASSPITTPGGVAGYVPVFTGASVIGDSILFQSATKIGVNTAAPAATLDVNGSVTAHGLVKIENAAIATTTAGKSSQPLEFVASAYSSSTAADTYPFFQLQAEAAGNDTATPSGTLNLLYGNGTAPAETGLSINSKGILKFAAGQTFPGASGSGITGVTATSPLSGGGTSGTVTVGLNLASLETSLNPVYARLTAANSFTSSATFAGSIVANGTSGASVRGNNSLGSGVVGYASGQNGWGVYGYTIGKSGIGVYGNATGGGGPYPIGVLGHVVSGTAVKGILDDALNGQAAVLGQTHGASSTYTVFETDGLGAGVWGDAADNTGVVTMGVAGTSDNGYAGVFENHSNTFETLFVFNGGTGGTGLPTAVTASAAATAAVTEIPVMSVGSRAGTCQIGGSGSISCTGQVKSVVTTASTARQVETYTMQSPENWMEDFGASALKSGAVTVNLDPVFAETVSAAADYHVFLTPRGDSKGLYVTNLTATSFEVHESGGGTTSIGFDYRIVAKRRGLEAQRLTDVTEAVKAQTALSARLTVKQ